jgi:hypothetical protein
MVVLILTLIDPILNQTSSSIKSSEGNSRTEIAPEVGYQSAGARLAATLNRFEVQP